MSSFLTHSIIVISAVLSLGTLVAFAALAVYALMNIGAIGDFLCLQDWINCAGEQADD